MPVRDWLIRLIGVGKTYLNCGPHLSVGWGPWLSEKEKDGEAGFLSLLPDY